MKDSRPYFTWQGLTIFTHFPDGRSVVIPNIEPIVDENCAFTGIIGVYAKGGGLPKIAVEFIQKYRKYFKFIWISAAGPYFYQKYKRLYSYYDAVTALDCCFSLDRVRGCNLELNYSMFARCGPLPDGFFWEPVEKKTADFSILTWYGDSSAKVWPHALSITCALCNRGFSGIIVTQRGTVEDLRSSELGKYEAKGLLNLYCADMNEKEFHRLIASAKFGIFPNQQDALPKHLIETVLADKPVVISPKLLFGRKTFESLGPNITKVVDFEKLNAIDEIIAFMITPPRYHHALNG
jgi:hypothetical protein